MALFGAIEIPGRPALENIRKLDLLALPLLYQARRLGFAIDPPYFAELKSKFEAEMRDLEKDIASYIPIDRLHEFSKAGPDETDDDEDEIDYSTGEPKQKSPAAFSYDDFNASSPEQIGKLLFEILNIDAHTTKKLKRTNKGAFSTGKKQLELLHLEHPVVAKVLRHRELDKLVATYCGKLPRIAVFHPRGSCCPVCELRHEIDQWRVHGEMGTTRAETGRINHKNPNLGNIPARTKDGQAVQAGFMAPVGHRIINGDLSQIELRGLAHLANCPSMIDIYAIDGDLHTDTCYRTGLTKQGATPTVAERMGAKRCIAEGQRVLTPRGRIAIEAVTCHDLVWDGIEWVSHDGVVCNGYREVITHDGLTATPDHEVYTTNFQKITLRAAQSGGIGLAVTGIEEDPVRYSNDSDLRTYHEESEWVPSSLRAVLSMPWHLLYSDRQHQVRQHDLVPMSEELEVQGRAVTTVSRPLSSYCATLRESTERELSQLRRPWYQKSVQWSRRVRKLYSDSFAPSFLQRVGHWAQKQRRKLRTRESTIGRSGLQPTQQAHEPLARLQGGENNCGGSVRTFKSRLPMVQPFVVTHNEVSSVSTMDRNSEAEAPQPVQKAFVYDIVNAGPRHRYTVENKLVVNCNFSIQNGGTEKGLYLQLVMDFGGKKEPIPEWLTEDWCKWFIGAWLDSRPEVRLYFEKQWYRARRYGRVWDLFGRVRLIPEVRSSHSWIVQAGLRQAQNMPVTALAAEQLKLAMGKITARMDDLREAGVWCWPLLTIHDAIMIEAEEKYADLVNDTLLECLDGCMTDEQTGELRFRVPIKSDSKISCPDKGEEEKNGGRWKK